MGNTTPTPNMDEAVMPPKEDGYVWPENIYVESRDMVSMAFFASIFGYILDVGRKDGPLAGLSIDSEGHVKRDESPLELGRSFTPSEVKTLIQDNEDKICSHFPREFGGSWKEAMFANLDKLEERAKSGDDAVERPLTLEEYDDKHQNQEVVYAICKDCVNKRITIVFRGSDKLAMKSNWLHNLSFSKKSAKVPEVVADKVTSDKIWFHSGFYDYIFCPTVKTDDEEGKTKYDEILEEVKFLMKKNPDFKLFVTGHSLGAALASLFSFFLSCEEDIPKPVTCLTFASPRIGDSHFLEAIQAFEEEGRMRFVRVMNDNDTIAVMPCVGYYHAGIQVRLYSAKEEKPEIRYPKKNDSWGNWVSQVWGNSVPKSLNVSYDHSVKDYQERLEKDEKELMKYNVNQLYCNKEWTGFD